MDMKDERSSVLMIRAADIALAERRSLSLLWIPWTSITASQCTRSVLVPIDRSDGDAPHININVFDKSSK